MKTYEVSKTLKNEWFYIMNEIDNNEIMLNNELDYTYNSTKLVLKFNTDRAKNEVYRLVKEAEELKEKSKKWDC